jgi:hypothetical protein
VFADQGKASLCMVERQLSFPIRRCVARLTRSAETPEMRILFGMATRACLRRAPKMLVPTVTSQTLCTRMASGKRIVRQIVIKSGGVKLNQLKAAAVMITMAGLALRAAGR